MPKTLGLGEPEPTAFNDGTRKVGWDLLDEDGAGYRISWIEKAFDTDRPECMAFACNHGITLANTPGIIDPGYRGEIRCKMLNLGTRAYTIYPGERIAQLVFLPLAHAVFNEEDSLPDSSRGDGGYGSTGAM